VTGDVRSGCEEYAELLASEPLGSIEVSPRKALDDHVSSCDSCRELRAEYERVAELLPQALPQTRVRPEVRDRLRLRLALRARQRQRRPVMMMFAGVAAAVVLAVAAGAIANRALSGHSDGAPIEGISGSERFDLQASANAPDADGVLAVNPASRGVVLSVRGLPQLDHQIYQLWFIHPDGSRISGNTFTVDERGNALHTAALPADISEFVGAGVTIEPEGGSQRPTGDNVLRARFSQD
jgi:anti-sigma-K factor RskA